MGFSASCLAAALLLKRRLPVGWTLGVAATVTVLLLLSILVWDVFPTCFDAETGRLLWSRPVAGVPASPPEVPQVTADTGFAAPSMATDGKGAFAIFANGDVAAFELDGRPRWARNLGLPENHYGHSSSLLAWNDFLLIQYDEGARPRLLALKTADGETAWEVVRETEISWASPILVRQGTADMLILNASPAVAAYLARTGRFLPRFFAPRA